MIMIRNYQEGDIFKMFLSPREQYNMQYLREDVLMASIAFTGINDQKDIVGCGGLAELWEGVFEAWFALNTKFKEQNVSILKSLKLSLDGLKNHTNVARVQAHMNENTENQEKLMGFLEFEKEAKLIHYFPYRENCILYRRLYD